MGGILFQGADHKREDLFLVLGDQQNDGIVVPKEERSFRHLEVGGREAPRDSPKQRLDHDLKLLGLRQG